MSFPTFDRSFSSLRTTLTDLKPASSPRPDPFPTPNQTHKCDALASSSTISRDSLASSESPFAKKPHVSRFKPLPKAPVFLHNRPLSSRNHTVLPQEKRCISDIHLLPSQRKQKQAQSSQSQTSHPRDNHARNNAFSSRHHTDIHTAVRCFSDDEDIPNWIPDEEFDNWTASPEPPHQPSPVHHSTTTPSPSQKWASSWRSLTNFYRPRQSPPCIRGSILEVQPPTLTERFGLTGLATEKSSLRSHRSKENTTDCGRVKFSRKNPQKPPCQPQPNLPNAQPISIEKVRQFDSMALQPIDTRIRDDYVGFLVEPMPQRRNPRNAWFNFLRRRKP